MHGVANSKIETLGSLEKEVEIDGIRLCIKFHVVKECDIGFPAILGMDAFNHVDVLMKDGRIHFSPKNIKFNIKEDKIEPITPETNGFPNEFHTLVAAATEGEFQIETEINLEHLNKEHKGIIEEMMAPYKPMRNCPTPIQMKILVKDEQPVCHRPRRVAYSDQKLIENQVAEWLQDGIIRPSVSPYASPIVLVGKKDGTKRMCCDFRKVNEKIIRDKYSMPLIDDVVERLQKTVVFTTLDLKDGFFHVPMERASAKYTAFVTKIGQYEFNFVPFGICNSPAVFTRFIMAVMRNFIQDGTMVLCMDDMVISATYEGDAIRKLKRVLEQSAKYGLKFKWKKCQFLVRRVKFLGYVIQNCTIKPSEEKLNAVTNFPLPANKQAVQRFVGLNAYFRRFIKNYAVLAKPLTDLLRGNSEFILRDEQLLAFHQLKMSLTKAPVLKLFNPEAETEIHTDACMYGYGGVFLQRDSEDQEFHPIQYMSRNTNLSEELLHSYELEVLAVIEALKKWRKYALGRQFKIITDCNAFAMTMRKQDIPAKVSRWAMFMQQFDYSIEHRSGSKMRHVDALIRVNWKKA